MNFLRRQSRQAEIDALNRAADAAHEAGDREHETALRQAAQFKTRVKREEEAGFRGWPVAAFIGNI